MHTLYLAGFNTVSEQALRTFFAGIQGRPTGWTVVDRLADAEAILVFAPEHEALQQAQGMAAPSQEIVLVGHSDYGSGWHVVQRPVTPTFILQGLNHAMQIKYQGADSVVDWDDSRLGATAHLPLTRETRHGDLPPAHLPDRDLPREIRAVQERSRQNRNPPDQSC